MSLKPPAGAPRRTSSLLHRFRRLDSSPIEEEEGHRLGIHEVTGNITTPIVTIIFIHGLGGHPIRTWRYSSQQESKVGPASELCIARNSILATKPDSRT